MAQAEIKHIFPQQVGQSRFAQQPTLLKAKGVSLGYQRKDHSYHQVLQNFSMQLRQGEVIALLGPSGVGKSSLLRVLAGLKTAAKGDIHLEGELLDGPSPKISFMFQDACLLPWLNVEDNVGFGLNFKRQKKLSKKERQQRVATAIEEVGLADSAKAYPNELSGGMAQRVALARSLARQPDILLLDEPFSALDEITRTEMQALLKTLTKRHNTSVVLVTHNIDEALNLADQVNLITGKPGRLIKQWHIDLPHPRDPAEPTLVQARLDIIAGMRQGMDAFAVNAA